MFGSHVASLATLGALSAYPDAGVPPEISIHGPEPFFALVIWSLPFVVMIGRALVSAFQPELRLYRTLALCIAGLLLLPALLIFTWLQPLIPYWFAFIAGPCLLFCVAAYRIERNLVA